MIVLRVTLISHGQPHILALDWLQDILISPQALCAYEHYSLSRLAVRTDLSYRNTPDPTGVTVVISNGRRI